MSDNELRLRPIRSLLDDKLEFYIPAYQRGYRWKSQQVTDLLDDIREFYLNSKDTNEKSFYCLQPIVVKKKRENSWEVVDGQQRLTTIYIILTCLLEVANADSISRYNIRYETRSDSDSFLDNIDSKNHKQNIDFFHIYNAKKAVELWFEKQQYPDKYQSIQEPLLNLDDKNIKVIWYELGDSEQATEVFSRLNIGKIPLVNAELIKALFLKSNNFSIFLDSDNAKHLQQFQQLTISQEWDNIEKSLQNNAFWYFLSNNHLESNRIELLLKLSAISLDSTGIEDDDKLKTFLQFNKLLNTKNVNVIQEWLNIKKRFMVLEEWFNDRELFHLIGFLIQQGTSIHKILALNEISQSKQNFKCLLTTEVFNRVFPENLNDLLSKIQIAIKLNTHLNNLTYKLVDPKHPPSPLLTFNIKSLITNLILNNIDEYLKLSNYGSLSTDKLRRILLLFNVISLLRNPKSNSRFQFDRFKCEHWDVEHIRSVTSDMPKKTNSQKDWLVDVKEYLKSIKIDEKAMTDEMKEKQSIKNEVSHILKAKIIDQVRFEAVYIRIISIYDPDGDEIVDDSIGNLTLLDSGTNRSYKNAIFPIKRKKIIELDKQATYVPLCTKNVFLKYYSKNIDNMLYWGKEDSENHQEEMLTIMTDFFTKIGAQQ